MTQEEFGKACIGLGCLCIALPIFVIIGVPLFIMGCAMIAEAFGG